MKKGTIFIICGLLMILFVSCDGKQNENKEILKSVEKTINETFTKSEELERSTLQEDDFWNSLIKMYEADYDFFSNLDIEAINDKELKDCINNYMNGAKIRVEAYRAYKQRDIATFETQYEHAKGLIDPSLVELVEKYDLKIDYQNKDMYKFIKGRLEQK